jgi:hypothetical protein
MIPSKSDMNTSEREGGGGYLMNLLCSSGREREREREREKEIIT